MLSIMNPGNAARFTFKTFAGKIKSLEATVQNLTAEIKALKAAKQ